jgi:transposase-like protein
MRMVKRVRRSEGEWRGLFARQSSSGLRVSEFCRREGINAGLFRRWRTALARSRRRSEVRSRARSPAVSAPPAAPATAPFIDLGAVGNGGGRCEVRLEFGDGLVLSVVRG